MTKNMNKICKKFSLKKIKKALCQTLDRLKTMADIRKLKRKIKRLKKKIS